MAAVVRQTIFSSWRTFIFTRVTIRPYLIATLPSRTSGIWAGQEEHEDDQEHEKEMSFLGRPKDWIERLQRHFMITDHTI